MADELKEHLVTGDDGKKYYVVANTEEQAQQDLKKHLGSNKSWGQTASDVLGTVAQGAGVIGQVVPHSAAAIEAGINPVTGIGSEGESFKDRYKSNLDRLQQNSAKFQEDNPKTAMAARVAGGTAAAIPVVKGANTIANSFGGAKTLIPQMATQGVAGGTMGVADRVAERTMDGSSDKLSNTELLKSFLTAGIPSALLPGASHTINPYYPLKPTAKETTKAAWEEAAKHPDPINRMFGPGVEATTNAIKSLPNNVEKGGPNLTLDVLKLLGAGAGALHSWPMAMVGYAAAPVIQKTAQHIKPKYAEYMSTHQHPGTEDILKALAQSSGIQANRDLNR